MVGSLICLRFAPTSLHGLQLLVPQMCHKGRERSRKPSKRDSRRLARASLIRMRSVVQVHVGPQLTDLGMVENRL